MAQDIRELLEQIIAEADEESAELLRETFFGKEGRQYGY